MTASAWIVAAVLALLLGAIALPVGLSALDAGARTGNAAQAIYGGVVAIVAIGSGPVLAVGWIVALARRSE